MTLDKHTCEICAAMDGKVIDKKDYQPGVTVPPFHPNCRGTTVPWFDDMADVGQRIARDNEGEVYYVPPDMTYGEWEKTFQEGGSKKTVAKLTETGIMKLTKAEEAAINRYISSDAYKVNAALREAEDISSLSQEMQSFIHDLDSALKKFPRYEGTVVRTLNFSDFSDGESKLNAFLKEHEVGSTVKSSQYLSTSKAGGYNPDAEVKLFILNAQKGRDITAFNPSENEVLFERESSFTVIQKKKVNGAWQIFLMEGE